MYTASPDGSAMQRKTVAWVLVFAGLGITVAGLWLLAGAGWATLSGGILLMVIGLLVVDVESPAPVTDVDDGQPAA